MGCSFVCSKSHLDIRNFKMELMKPEATDGWQYVESTIYDVGVTKRVHTMALRTVLFATPAVFLELGGNGVRTPNWRVKTLPLCVKRWHLKFFY